MEQDAPDDNNLHEGGKMCLLHDYKKINSKHTSRASTYQYPAIWHL